MQSHLFLGAMVVGALATSTAISAITPHDLVSLSAEITDVPRPGQFRGAEAAADSESADETNAQEPTPGLASVKCEVAQVNPVTGHAECIRPRGAAVDPPPQSAVRVQRITQLARSAAARNCRQTATRAARTDPISFLQSRLRHTGSLREGFPQVGRACSVERKDRPSLVR
jgi:hypothetical protein